MYAWFTLVKVETRPLTAEFGSFRVLVMREEGGCAEGGWPGSLFIATEAANVACVMDK